MSTSEPGPTFTEFYFDPEMEQHPLVVHFRAEGPPSEDHRGAAADELMQGQAGDWADQLLARRHPELGSEGVRDRVGSMIFSMIAHGWKIGRATAAHAGHPLKEGPTFDELADAVLDVEPLDRLQLPGPVLHLFEMARWQIHRHAKDFIPDLAGMKKGSQLWLDVTTLLEACLECGYGLALAQASLAQSALRTEVLGPWILQRDADGVAWANALTPDQVHVQPTAGAREVVVGLGRDGHDVVVIEVEQARALARAWSATRAATLEEAISLLPEPYRSEVIDLRDEAADDGNEFDLDGLYWWAVEGGFEWPNQQMLTLLPEALIDRLGKRGFSGVSGPCVTIDVARREELVEALQNLGLDVTEDDTLTRAACGADPPGVIDPDELGDPGSRR